MGEDGVSLVGDTVGDGSFALGGAKLSGRVLGSDKGFPLCDEAAVGLGTGSSIVDFCASAAAPGDCSAGGLRLGLLEGDRVAPLLLVCRGTPESTVNDWPWALAFVFALGFGLGVVASMLSTGGWACVVGSAAVAAVDSKPGPPTKSSALPCGISAGNSS